MNLLSSLALALSMSTLVACGGSAASRAPSFSAADDAAWRPAEITEMKFEPKLASNTLVSHEDAAPVPMKPNARENPHGILNAVRQ